MAPAQKANPWAPPTQQQDYNQGAQQRMSQPTAAQSYYAAYQPTTIAGDALSNRQQNGYGASAVADRYQSQLGTQNQQTASGSIINQLAGFDATQRGDNFSNGLKDANIGTNAANAQGLFNERPDVGRAGRDGRRERPDRVGPIYQRSGERRFRHWPIHGSYLNSGNSDTGRFLAGFDPNSTQALGENYQRLKSMGPTYEEDFYTSQLAGDNPAYNQLKADFIKDQQRASAARGAFVNGNSMDLEQRGLSRLAGR